MSCDLSTSIFLFHSIQLIQLSRNILPVFCGLLLHGFTWYSMKQAWWSQFDRWKKLCSGWLVTGQGYRASNQMKICVTPRLVATAFASCVSVSAVVTLGLAQKLSPTCVTQVAQTISLVVTCNLAVGWHIGTLFTGLAVVYWPLDSMTLLWKSSLYSDSTFPPIFCIHVTRIQEKHSSPKDKHKLVKIKSFQRLFL